VSVYERMTDRIEEAFGTDECEWELYRDVMDLIGEAEAREGRMRELIHLVSMCNEAAGYCEFCAHLYADEEDAEPRCHLRPRIDRLSRELGVTETLMEGPGEPHELPDWVAKALAETHETGHLAYLVDGPLVNMTEQLRRRWRESI